VLKAASLRLWIKIKRHTVAGCPVFSSDIKPAQFRREVSKVLVPIYPFPKTYLPKHLAHLVQRLY